MQRYTSGRCCQVFRKEGVNVATIIIDGICKERSLYARHVADLTGWPIVTYPASDDIQGYLTYSPGAENVIIDGFHTAHRHGVYTSPQDLKNTAYTAAKLMKRVDIQYTLVTTPYEVFVGRDLDDYIRLAQLHRIILDPEGCAVAGTYSGTIKQQEKHLYTSRFTPYKRRFENIRSDLYAVYGR